MTFLYPNVLWALVLLIIPILLHFFQVRRYKKVYFTNLSFLSELTRENKSTSRLKRLLILISRLLLLLFMIVAFARPQFSKLDEEFQFSKGAIAIDNSLSTQILDKSGKPALYEVHRYVKKELEKSENEWSVYDNDGLIYNSVELEKVGLKFSNRSLLLSERIQRLKTENPELIHLISDFQKFSSDGFDYLVGDSSSNYLVHNLSLENGSNIYVDSVWLNYPIGYSTSNLISIEIVNSGNTSRNNVLLRVDRDSVQLSSMTVNLDPNARYTYVIEQNSSENLSGRYLVTLVDEYVTFDNTFYFTLPKGTKTNVLIISSTISETTYIRNVFENEQYFNLNINPLSDIDMEILNNSDFVVLNRLDQIPDWLNMQLNNSKTKLLVLPKVGCDINSYSEFLSLNIQEKDIDVASLSEKSLETPLLKGVFDNTINTTLPYFKPILEISGRYETILELESTLPVMVRNEAGYYFLLTDFQDSLTNFHKHALFLPLMYHLAQSNFTAPLYIRNGTESITLKSGLIEIESVLKFLKEGESFIGNYSIRNDELSISIPEMMNDPGFYNIVLNDSSIATLGFNNAKEESLMEFYSSEELENLLGRYSHIKIKPMEILGDEQRTEKDNNEAIWKYALLLVLLFVTIESLILRFVK
ncbi:MAG: BatA domain-containing protein [Cyclobacteriaceae bacterium]